MKRDATGKLPPGPREPPLVQTLRWLARPIEFMDSCRRLYGEAFSVRLLGLRTPTVMLSDPEAVRALYTARESELPPRRLVALRPLLGPRSLLLLEGAEHLARRKLLLPSFHGEQLRAYESLIREIAAREVETWPQGRAFPLRPRMQALTFEVILRAVFGVSDAQRLRQLRVRLRTALDATCSPRLQFGVLLARRFGRAGSLERVAERRAAVDELLSAEIAERRAARASGTGVLSLLIDARFEDGAPMSDAELRDELITLLLAGHETTATALAWAFDLLLRHPQALARVRAEIDRGEDAYRRAVVSESLRLRPVVPTAGRRLARELAINGFTLPAGTDVTPAIWLTHTRPDLYPDPLVFRPERFLDGAPPTYAWIPFGGGSHRCLGASFAELEMRVVLREALSRCALRCADDAPERVARRNVTLAPRRGTRVVVEGPIRL